MSSRRHPGEEILEKCFAADKLFFRDNAKLGVY
jgi:hypothetical protein